MSFKHPRRKKPQPKKPGKEPRDIIREARRKQARPVKLTAEIPDEVYAQVARTEEETSQGSLPATVITPPGRPFKDSLVVMRLESFQRYFDAKPTDIGEGS